MLKLSLQKALNRLWRRLGAGCIAAGLALSSPLAHADIYKFTDEEGRVTFSNIPMKGATKVYSDPVTMGGRPRAGSGSSKSGTSRVNAPSPADFPKVDSGTQKSRDTNRRKILQDELSTEQGLLTDARKALVDAQNSPADAQINAGKYNDKIMRLRDNATFHEKNVDALTAELSRSK